MGCTYTEVPFNSFSPADRSKSGVIGRPRASLARWTNVAFQRAARRGAGCKGRQRAACPCCRGLVVEGAHPRGCQGDPQKKLAANGGNRRGTEECVKPRQRFAAKLRQRCKTKQGRKVTWSNSGNSAVSPR
eukprot:gene19818-biopygen20557